MVAKLACFLHLQPPGLCVGVQRLEVPPARALASRGEWRSSDELDFSSFPPPTPVSSDCIVCMGAVLAPMLGAGRGGCGYRSNLYIPTYS